MAVAKSIYTRSDFEALIALPDNAHRRFEFVDGEIVEKLPTEEHGLIVANILTAIKNYLKINKIGRVGVEIHYRPANDELNDRMPDISFSSDLTRPVVRHGAVPQMPDLAVEVKSPDQTYKYMSDCAAYYLAQGTQLVWLVYPEKRLVEVLTRESRELRGETESIDGGGVLPAFALPVREIFEE